jgi:signal transduction histidine kinase
MNARRLRRDVLTSANQRLALFIAVDVVTTTSAVIMLIVVHFVVYSSPYVLALGAMVAVAAVTMALGIRPLRRANPARAVLYLAVANYGIALAVTAIATFAMPMLLVTTLLPVVLAVPYVDFSALRRYVAASGVAATGVVLLGSVQDITGFSDDLPSWVPPAVVVFFTPFMASLVTVIAVTNSKVLGESLQESLQTNRDLSIAQSSLARTADELRSSRSRLVATADRERRRIERDLHDGAQQRLVGVAVQLAVVRERVATTDPMLATELAAVREQLHVAVSELRELAHGVYPPTLTQRGLAPALGGVVARLPLAISTDLRATARYPAEAETAVYFCCLEALQNTLKHAGPNTPVTLRLEDTDGALRLEVTDRGPGFNPDDQPRGDGFTNMADRLGAAGGDLSVNSAPGRGTSVVGTVPLVTSPK